MNWLYHFLGISGSGPYYGFWSGFGSDLGELTLVGVMFGVVRQHNCHTKGCWRLGRFTHGHYKLCHLHHPLVPDDGNITEAHIEGVTSPKS